MESGRAKRASWCQNGRLSLKNRERSNERQLYGMTGEWRNAVGSSGELYGYFSINCHVDYQLQLCGTCRHTNEPRDVKGNPLSCPSKRVLILGDHTLSSRQQNSLILRRDDNAKKSGSSLQWPEDQMRSPLTSRYKWFGSKTTTGILWGLFLKGLGVQTINWGGPYDCTRYIGLFSTMEKWSKHQYFDVGLSANG